MEGDICFLSDEALSMCTNKECLIPLSHILSIGNGEVCPCLTGFPWRHAAQDRYGQAIHAAFMKSIMKDDRYLAVGPTHVLRMSDGGLSARLGHNSMEEYLPQVQVLVLFYMYRNPRHKST